MIDISIKSPSISRRLLFVAWNYLSYFECLGSDLSLTYIQNYLYVQNIATQNKELPEKQTPENWSCCTDTIKYEQNNMNP